jgi:hypothetical protein
MHDHERMAQATDVLRGVFGAASADPVERTITVRVDGFPAVVDFVSGVRVVNFEVKKRDGY